MVPDKINLQEMIEEVAEKLVVYLKDGRLSTQSFLKKIDLKINNIEELLRLHFIIKKDLVKFIKKLPLRIRSIKTSTQKINRRYNNQVRGRIDWQSTISSRYSQNYRDNTLFVCEQTSKNFDIKENIVLKKLISIIYGIIINDLDGKPENYCWLDEWLGDEDLASMLEEFYFRNIYLNRIDIQEVTVTNRMIQDTKNSRNLLYREAAELLEFYREQIERKKWLENTDEIITLLRNTFIIPEKISVLFELYWVLKLLENNTEKYQMELIKEGQNIVARWKKENKRYTLYHDCDASKELEWSVKLSEFSSVENEFLKRKIKGIREAYKISKLFRSSLKPTVWSGRPDLVIEVRDNNGKLRKVFIGEVKYTNREDTAKQGLKELMEYCHLLKYKGKYFEEKNIKIEGLLLLDKIELLSGDFLKAIRIKKIDAQEGNYQKLFTEDIKLEVSGE